MQTETSESTEYGGDVWRLALAIKAARRLVRPDIEAELKRRLMMATRLGPTSVEDVVAKARCPCGWWGCPDEGVKQPHSETV